MKKIPHSLWENTVFLPFFLGVTKKMLKGRNARSIHCNVLSFLFAFKCCLQPAQYPNLELSHTLLKAPEAAASGPQTRGRQAAAAPLPAPFQARRVRGVLRMFRLWDKRPERPDASNEKKEEPHRRLSQKGTEAAAAPAPPHPAGPSPGGSAPPHCPRGGGGRWQHRLRPLLHLRLPPAAPQGKAGSSSLRCQSGGARRRETSCPRFSSFLFFF